MKNLYRVLLPTLALVFLLPGYAQTQGPTLWGMSRLGGNTGQGNIFSYAANTTSSKYTFGSGEYPYGALTLSRGKDALFGMTYGGGDKSLGSIFRYDLNTRTLTTVHSFLGLDAKDGATPFGAITEGSDGALYGMTNAGGNANKGVIFRLSLKDGYKILHHFAGGKDGANPYGSLLEAEGLLIGMTYAGGDPSNGTAGVGTIFALNMDGSNYRTYGLPLDGSRGKYPYGSLTQGQDKLTFYGMTYAGSADIGSYGVLFEFNLKSFAVTSLLHGFVGNGKDGASPFGDVVYVKSAQTLYGLTYAGGASNAGTLFSYGLERGNFAIRYHFNTDVGNGPMGSLLRPTSDSSSFYGTTTYGGSSTYGTLFKWNSSSGLITLSTFDGKSAQYPNLSKLVEYTPTACKAINAPTASTAVNTCVGATAAPLTATPLTAHTLLWYGTDASGNASLQAPTPATGSASSYTYYVSQIAQGCESPKASIRVNVNSLPPSPGVNSPIAYCQGQSTTALTATQTAKGGLFWYGTTATGGTASTIAPIPSSAVVGSMTYYVSQKETTGCESHRAAITVTVNGPPSPPIVANVEYCLNDTTSQLTAQANSYTLSTAVIKFRLIWYGTSATGGTASTVAPTPSSATAGTINYYVSQTNPLTGCESPRAPITVTTHALPKAPEATSPLTACLNGPAPVLTAAGSSLTWYTSLTSPGSSAAPALSTQKPTTTNYYVTQTDVYGCESANTTIAYTVNTTPSVPKLISIADTICHNSLSPNLSSWIADITSPGQLYWYKELSTGTTKPSTIVPKVDSSLVGTHTLYVYRVYNSCASVAQKFTITVQATPAEPLAPNVPIYCEGDKFTLAAVGTSAGRFYWYTKATGGLPLNNPYNTSASATSTLYYLIDSTRQGCKSARVPVKIPVTTRLTPTVTLSVPSTTLCAGSTVTFTASATHVGKSPSYQWVRNNIFQGPTTTNNTFTVSNIANNDSIWVILTSDATCLTTTTATSNKIKMQVGSSVVPVVKIATPNTTICSGAAITFSASIANGGTTPSYQWRVNGQNVTGATSNIYTVSTLADKDTVTALLTSNSTCATTPTALSNKVGMKVQANVNSTTTVTALNGTSLCAGSIARFKAQGQNTGSFPTYQWAINNVNIGNPDTSTIFSSRTLATGDKVTVTMTSRAACLIANPVTSAALTITILSPVTPAVSLSSTSNTICQGSALTFTATSTHGGSIPLFQWRLNGNAVGKGTSTNTFTSTSLTDQDVVSVSLASNATCVTQQTALSNDITVSVNPMHSPIVSITANAARVNCEGTALTFTATSTGAGSTPAYQWKVNNSNAGTGGSTFTTSVLKPYDSVYVVMQSSAVCLTAASATSNKIKPNISLKVTPTVTITSSSSYTCKDSTATFTATATSGGPNPTFEWKVNGVSTGSASSANIFSTKTLKDSDLVSVTLVPNISCVTATSVNATNPIQVSVRPTITPNVSLVSPATLCEGSKITFTASSTQGAIDALYIWKVNDSDATTSMNNTFTRQDLGTGDVVSVVLKSKQSCLSVDSAKASTSTLNMQTTPVLLEQPSAATACIGANASFAVQASGTNLSYQWSLNGSNIAGASSPLYNVTAVSQNQDGNQYSVVVRGACGSIASNAVQLTVVAPPQIASQPTSNASCANGDVLFTVTALGTGLSYQWQENGITLANTGIYSGTTSDTLKLTGVSSTQNGNQYRVLISNGCAPQAQSTSALLTVGTNFTTSVAIKASDTTTCLGSEVIFTATSINGGTSPTYQWLINGSAASGATGSIYSTDSLRNRDTVSCRLTSSNVCIVNKTVNSPAVLMEVNSTAPTITHISATPVCDKGSSTIEATTAEGTLLWYNTASGGSPVGAGSRLSTPELTSTAYYFAEAHHKGCTSLARAAIKVQVDHMAQVSAGPDSTICAPAGSTIILRGNTSTGHLVWRDAAGTTIPQIDSLTASYKLLPADILSGIIYFIALSNKNGACTQASDTITYKIVSGSGTQYVQALDSSIVAGWIALNFPSAQTTYKADDPKTWKGMKTACGYITELRLPSLDIQGILHNIQALSQLEVLDLSDNKIDSIHNLLESWSPRIRHVDISGNHMSYDRAIELAYQYLDTLDISDNAFSNTWTFKDFSPSYVNAQHNEISSLVVVPSQTTGYKTKHLDLSHNRLATNRLSIDSLAELAYLDLSHNECTSFPPLSETNRLKSLNLSYNKLEGRIPNTSSMPQLEVLNLSHNNIEAGLEELQTNLALSTIDVGNNAFQGNHDADFSKLSKLLYFAIDSCRIASTDKLSGISSLPILPLTTGLTLHVQDNHLDFEDLQPYAALIAKNQAYYIPQYDSIDQAYVTKPAVGSFMKLNTSLNGARNTYQWVKYKPNSSESTALSYPTAKEQTLKKVFAVSDTGRYAVLVANTDFPGLQFVRRPIAVETCEFSYTTNFFMKKPNLDKCFGIDTLFVEFRTRDNKPVTAFSNVWYFNDRSVISASQKYIPVHVSGVYTFLAYDSLSGCSIFSKDTLMASTSTKLNPALEIDFSTVDSSVAVAINFNEEAVSLQWVINGVPIAGANSKKLRIHYNGSYQLITIKQDSCSAISEPLHVTAFPHSFVRETQGLDHKGMVHLSRDEELKIFPNPAQDIFSITGLHPGDLLEFKDLQGHQISSHTAYANVVQIDASTLATGLYLLHIKHASHNRLLKVAINR